MAGFANDWLGQTLSDGRYRVDAKLGEGGMGFVYKVWDRNLDTDVVIKVPRRSMLDDPEFAARFSLEIRSLVKLSHPHIVKVSDVGEQDGLPFAVMQYLSGGTLDERLQYDREGRPAPAAPGSLSSWLPGMASALDFIHRKNYIHRDVKPANILFDTDGYPYLSDFGVAKVVSDVEASAKRGPALTGVGIVLGTPDYMAPELIMGGTFDGRVDQYALAVTAYEILCGRKPFTGETPTAILVRQTTQAPPPMAELSPSGADAIGRVIFKGLAKLPSDRYSSCAEFSAALMAALAKANPSAVERLNCPSCGTGFAVPADIASYKGKKSRCQVCKATFRFSMDGLTLLPIDADSAADGPKPTPTPSAGVELAKAGLPPASPRANATVKLGAMPPPAAQPTPQASRTVKIEALPTRTPGAELGPARATTQKLGAIPGPAVPTRAAATQKLAAIPLGDAPEILDEADPVSLQDDVPAGRSPLPWAIGAGVAVLGIIGMVFTLAPKKGTLPIRLQVPSAGAVISVDGERLDPERLKAPLTLAVGTHRLEAEGGGYLPLSVDLAVVAGTNSPFIVRMKPVPPRPQPPVAVALAPSPPTTLATGPAFPAPAPASASPTDLASPPTPPAMATVAAASGVKTAEPEPEKVAAEVPPSRDNPEDHPDRNASVKSDATLKQIAADPASFVDRVVSPSDLLLISTRIGPRMGATPTLAVRTRVGSLQSLQKAGTPFEVVLKHELVAPLRDHVNTRILVEGDYPALVRMRIIKDPGKAGSYLGVVEWAEFLVYIDPRHISFKSSLYNRAFVVDNLADDGVRMMYSKTYEEWRKRLNPIGIVTNIRNAYVNAFKINQGVEYNQLSDQLAKNPAAHSRAFHKRLLDMIH